MIISNVSIERRIGALILDVCIHYMLWFVFSPILDLNIYVVLILQLLISFLDFIWLPSQKGYTVSRFILGYTIIPIDGTGHPNIKHLFLRWVTLWFINLISSGFISLASIIISKQNASVHDLISKTRVKRNKDVPLTSLPIFILILFLSLYSLIFKSFVDLDNSFIKPKLSYKSEISDSIQFNSVKNSGILDSLLIKADSTTRIRYSKSIYDALLSGSKSDLPFNITKSGNVEREEFDRSRYIFEILNYDFRQVYQIGFNKIIDHDYSYITPFKNYKKFSNRIIAAIYSRKINPNFEKIFHFPNLLLIESSTKAGTAYEIILKNEIWQIIITNQ